MVVKTQVTSPVAEKAQRGNLEFLLINHPLDCPVCDKGGECPLQNQAHDARRRASRASSRPSARSPSRSRSPSRCCSTASAACCAPRCTRFSEQIAGDPFIALIERGAQQQVGIYEDEPFGSYFSGNTIQICPVGALTSADYRFRSRPFDLVVDPVGRRARRVRLGDPRRPPSRQGHAPPRRRRPRGQRGVDHRQGPLRVHVVAPGATGSTTPLVRNAETGELEPTSWPGRARRRRARAGRGGRQGRRADRRSADRRGRLRLQPSSPASSLGTNDIDFRARAHSERGGRRSSRPHVAATPRRRHASPISRRPSTVVLVGLEPEDEAGTHVPAPAQGQPQAASRSSRSPATPRAV